MRAWQAYILLALMRGVVLSAGRTPLPNGAGEFGSDLALLEPFHARLAEGECATHVFDMWAGAGLAALMRYADLTNNRTLVINSHGKALRTIENVRYVYHPHARRLAEGKEMPYFSAADFATAIGPKAAAQIHNIVIAGCNKEGVFSSVELRSFFPNATNVIHSAAGEAGYQEMFRQIFFVDSADIQRAFQVRRGGVADEGRYEIVAAWEQGAVELKPYIAEIFNPSSHLPVRMTTAGRELWGPRAVLSAPPQSLADLLREN